MQFLSNISKFLIIALLSTGLVVSWDLIYVNKLEQINVATTQTNTDAATVFQSYPNYSPIDRYYSPVDSIYGDVDVVSNEADRSMQSSIDSIWSNISKNLNLDHRTNSSQVRAEIRKLLADKSELNRILKQAAPYIYFIYQQTHARGLPAELSLIPFIESEFNPNDRSHVGATGLWQLMPQTAKELGVKVKANYDGRRDVIASTKAALAYFKDLGNLFKGNWYLAIAAYNCGQGKILSEMKKTGSNSFWNIRVPKETRIYVPKLLAVAAIVKEPEKYGVQLPHIKNQPYFKEVKVSKPLNLEKVAKSTNTNLKTLKKLNPDYNHGMVAKKNGYMLLVPVDKHAVIEKHVENMQ